MKVVVPSNPYDAKGLMISAIRDDNPVLYLFHKGVMGLAWMEKNPRSIGEVPEGSTSCRSARRRVAREGRDVTIVTLSLSVHHALDAAEQLAGDGIDVEVLDLRSLVPLDRETILDSVAKTGRLVVVDEDYQSFGMSGEVAATVAETDPTLLKAPVQRLAVPDVPIPYAHVLEYAVLPRPDRIEEAVRRVRRPDDRRPVPRDVQGDPDTEGVVSTWFVERGRVRSPRTSCSPRSRSTRWPRRCSLPWRASCASSLGRRPWSSRASRSPGSSSRMPLGWVGVHPTTQPAAPPLFE